MPESEISLQSLIRVLTHRWHWVIGFTLLVFVLVFVFSLLFMENEYKASVKLLVSKSKVGDKIQPVDYTMYEPDTYMHLIRSRDSLAEVLQALGLDQSPWEYQLKDFENKVNVYPLRNTAILEIQVTLPDPGKAKEAANLLAQWAIRKNFELLLTESKQSRELFRGEVEASRSNLIESGRELSRFMAESKTAVSGHFFLSSQEALWKLKQDRSFNVALRDESKAKAESLLAILAEEPETRILKRGISEERDLLDMIRKKHPEIQFEDLLPIRIDNENVNYSYDKAKVELFDASKNYYGAIAHIVAMDKEIQEIEDEIRIAEQEMAEKKRRENELEIAANDYREISMKNAEANTTITSERQDLVVIEQAVLPEQPSAPQRLVISGSAAVFAFLLALLLSLLIDMYAVVERKKPGIIG